MRRQKQLQQRTAASVLRRVLAVSFAVLFVAATVRAAATWKGPVGVPTNITGLDSISDLSNFVSKTKLRQQKLQGPLNVKSSDSYPARFGVDATRQITTLSSAAENGEYNSIAIDRDGLAVIGMYHNNGSRVAFVRCTNQICSGLSTLLDFDSSDAGKYSSIAIGSDGFPVISYYRTSGSAGYVNVLHCTSKDCSTADAPQTLQQSASDFTFGRYTSIAIASDGNPIVSYWAGEDLDDLNVAHCRDVACKYFDTPVTLDSSVTVSGYTSIVVHSNGRPAISYAGGGEVRYAYCDDPYCTGSVNQPIDSNGHKETTLRLDATGLPIMSYKGDDNKPYIARCSNPGCTPGSVTVQKINDDPTEDIAFALAGDGNPVVVYYGPNGAGTLQLVRCLNIACSSLDPSSPVLLDSSSADIGEDLAIAIGSDGLPIIAYHDQINSRMRVLHCANLACDWTGTRYFGALGIGKASYPFGYLPNVPEAHYGVLGYGDGAGSYGVHAYSELGTALGGAVTKADDVGQNRTYSAGLFTGPVRIDKPASGSLLGNLEVERSLTNTGQVNLTSSSGVSAQVTQTTVQPDTFGVSGTTSGDSQVQKGGLIGYGVGQYGIGVATVNETTGALATAASSYGVYGYSADGTGVAGQGDPARTNAQGVYGESLDYGIYGYSEWLLFGKQSGAGVFACGTVTAAEFNGDVRIYNALNMGVGTNSDVDDPALPGAVNGRIVEPEVSLDQGQLESIAASCSAGATNPCPANFLITLP